MKIPGPERTVTGLGLPIGSVQPTKECLWQDLWTQHVAVNAGRLAWRGKCNEDVPRSGNTRMRTSGLSASSKSLAAHPRRLRRAEVNGYVPNTQFFLPVRSFHQLANSPALMGSSNSTAITISRPSSIVTVPPKDSA
jgi:hypothetical protein